VSIAPCCSVNAAFLFAEPRLVVVISKCAPTQAVGPASLPPIGDAGPGCPENR